ncbi:MAG TPA: flagellar biosynthetic protein FliO [Tepidisphaeraceae bacterium]|nr:flagellar biosynthetic protein FliO [Tepidisphaeraceae bacterium]
MNPLKRRFWILDFGSWIEAQIQNPKSKIQNYFFLAILLISCVPSHAQEFHFTSNSPVATSQPAAVDDPYSYPKILIAMGLVISLILALKWGATKFAPGIAARQGKSISVLSRLSVGPKQHLLLVRIGRRAVLVGNSGTQMSPLCEISDADELAHLVGQVESEKSVVAVGGKFASLFKKREQDFEPEAEVPALEQNESPADEQMAQTVRRELLGLTERVRGMSKDLTGL